MGSFANQKLTFSRQTCEKGWVMIEFFLVFGKIIFWTNSRDFFLVGHGSKISNHVLGRFATIYGIVRIPEYFKKRNF